MDEEEEVHEGISLYSDFDHVDDPASEGTVERDYGYWEEDEDEG